MNPWLSEKTTKTCGCVDILGIAWSFGGMIFILVYYTVDISGGLINPVVTFRLFLTRKVCLIHVVLYNTAQCHGSICGVELIKAFQSTYYVRYVGGVNSLNDGYSTDTGLGVKIIGTFVLIYIVFSATGPKWNASDSHLVVLASLSIIFDIMVLE